MMVKRKISFLFLLIFLCSILPAQNKKERAFQKAVFGIVNAYNKKDTRAINQYIHKQTPVFVLGTIGAANVWRRTDKLCLDSACTEEDPNALTYAKIMKGQRFKKLPGKIDRARSPVFNCETVFRAGLYHMLNRSHLTSATINNYIRHAADITGAPLTGEEHIRLEKELEKAATLERTMRVIVLGTREKAFWGNTFIFGLNYIDGKWYLTLIDFLSNDCSV